MCGNPSASETRFCHTYEGKSDQNFYSFIYFSWHEFEKINIFLLKKRHLVFLGKEQMWPWDIRSGIILLKLPQSSLEQKSSRLRDLVLSRTGQKSLEGVKKYCKVRMLFKNIKSNHLLWSLKIPDFVPVYLEEWMRFWRQRDQTLIWFRIFFCSLTLQFVSLQK